MPGEFALHYTLLSLSYFSSNHLYARYLQGLQSCHADASNTSTVASFRLSLIMCRGAEEDARLPMQGPPEARKPESSTCGTGLCPDGELSFPGTHALLGRAWAPVSVPSHPSCECWQLFELDHHLRRFYHRGCNGALIACSKVHEAHGPHPAAAAAAAANT